MSYPINYLNLISLYNHIINILFKLLAYDDLDEFFTEIINDNYKYTRINYSNNNFVICGNKIIVCINKEPDKKKIHLKLLPNSYFID